MIPNRQQCLLFFDKYNLPSEKRIHAETVAQLSLYFADKLLEKNIKLNKNLIEAAALLHDIDKNVTKLPNERHPDASVRILNELGCQEVAEIVKKHGLHCILDNNLTPKTWEEKILYLSDKMVKYEVIGIEHRFKLWYKENLAQEAVLELDKALPKVKELEKEIFTAGGIEFKDVLNKFNN